MKVKRLFFVVILAFILVICWLLGVRKISGVDEKKAQPLNLDDLVLKSWLEKWAWNLEGKIRFNSLALSI